MIDDGARPAGSLGTVPWLDVASRTYLGRNEDVPDVRRFVADLTDSWALDGGDVVLVASELATNAVLHGRTEFTVTVLRYADLVRIEVDDLSTRSAEPLVPETTATSGRGLTVVDALTVSWGVEPRMHGKCIWGEVRPVAAVV